MNNSSNIQNNWYVYLISTQKNKLYCGITTNLSRRFSQHLNKKGAKFFYSDKPIEIVYSEVCQNRSEASKREYQIKKLSRIQKLALVNQIK